jgi:L-Lysine epsilon oxidase N-terminal
VAQPAGNEIVVKAAIYPSIGIARVGNSLTAWYVGPEVPDPLPLPPGSYRDEAGALKREAARFRIYGLNAAGTPVRELTSADADITWISNSHSDFCGLVVG